jgi:hypothetical protein
MVDRGIGELLIPTSKCSQKFIPDMTFEEPLFDAEFVAEKFTKILTEDSFQIKMRKVQLECRSSGGRKAAADTVETVYFAGTDHLVDLDYNKKMWKLSCCTNCFLYIFILAFIGVFTWLLVDKIEME